MLAHLAQLSDMVDKALPLIFAGVIAIFVAILHWKDSQLAKAHTELSEKVDDIANAQHEQNILNLAAKVQADDQKRLQLENALPPGESTPGAGPGAGG